ncbi:hypothetical protein ES703_53049 [subsurface metagenome]
MRKKTKTFVIVFAVLFVIAGLVYAASKITITGSHLRVSSLQKGIVGHWVLDADSYNFNTARVTDKTPYENHGTNYGATFTADQMGQSDRAMGFDGVTDYVNCGDDASLKPVSAVSMAFWANPSAYQTVLANHQIGFRQGYGYTFWQWSSAEIPRVYVAEMNGVNATRRYFDLPLSLLPLDTWTHIAIIFDGANGKIWVYKNGILFNSRNVLVGDIIYSGGDVYIGNKFNGAISDVRIYNHALSAEEIDTLYHSYRPKVASGSLQKGLILDMPLKFKYTKDETPGSEILTDRTPYSNDGQNYGAVVGADYTTFDGSGDKIQLANSLGITNSNFTFSHWIKTTQADGQTYTIGNAGGESGYRFGIGGGRIQFLIGNGSGHTESTCGTTTIHDGNWHLITGVFDRGTAFNCYVDGVYGSSVSISSYSGMTDLAPGIGAPPCCTDFNGAISNVRIYNRVLSPSEIKLLYDQGR